MVLPMQLMQCLASSCLTSLLTVAIASAQPLKSNPTPADYVERNGGGASIVPAGKLVIDGYGMSCGQWATVLDPDLDDYAASYPQFVILNPRVIGNVATPVKLWIYSHECGHLLAGPDENKADCFAVQRGKRMGWLTTQALDQICAFISAAHADRMHLSGPNRCTLMRQCYRDSSQNQKR